MKNALRLVLVLFAPVVVMASDALIHDMEDLRNSLAANDPNRPTLTLRLADLYFDAVTEQGTTGAQQAQYRNKAAEMYEEALSGAKGQFRPVAGPVRLKVQFQLARVYTDLGQEEKAVGIWKQLAAQNDLIDLEREAILRLAEISESHGDLGKSESYFQQSLALCNGTDLCSYTHYRRAWLMKNQNRLNDSIAELQLALWDSKGQVREEALRDLVSFLGERGGDGKSETALIEGLMEKIHRPALLQDLSASFYAQGNRVAGSYVLSLVDQRAPSIKNKLRLLEQYYGLRDWDHFHRVLGEVRLLQPDSQIAAEVESEKALRRLIVQLDGERATKPEVAADFKAVVELQLNLFPQSGGEKDAFRFMEGWIAAESDPQKKAQEIQKWLDDSRYHLSTASQIELHETLAAIAQKSKDNPALVREMQALSRLTQDSAKKREYKYVGARAQYDMKQFDNCLPVFRELAAISGSAKPDIWAIQSQNLALDILAQRKEYTSVSAQAETWTNSKALKSLAAADAALGKELQDMQLISEQAQFEGATHDSSPGSLKVFLSFCEAKKMLPKSCDNAKIAAVRLKDEAALLEVLRLQGAWQELAAEYEAAGYFKESAALLEKQLTAASKPEERIKVALLYELGSDKADRDAVLRPLLKALGKQKTFGEKEELYLSTLSEAGLLGQDQLGWGWSIRNRAALAEYLEAQGRSTRGTEKALFDSLESSGPAWNKLILGRLGDLIAEQAKIKFYGARSKQRFTLRLAKIKGAADFTDKYYGGADAETKKRMIEIMSKCYGDLAAEIRTTPMQEGLTPEQNQQVKAALDEMAKPFDTRQGEYMALLQKITVGPAASSLATAAALPVPQAQEAEKALHANPNDRGALQLLQSYYQSTKQSRLASYFKGRLLHVQEN